MPTDIPTSFFYFFLSVTGIQIIYWLFFLIGLIKLKIHDRQEHRGLSIIVAAKNEIENLRTIIPALLSQNHLDFEVIIVNDRSDDGTDEFLISLEQKHDKLKALHIYEKPDHINAKKYAITLGIKAAKYKQVLLTDADCMPSSEFWASTMAGGFNEATDIVLGFSNYNKLPGILNYFIRFETLVTGIEFLASAANKLPYMGVGRNLAYKKDLFLENKGFFGYQELVGGDDDLFVNKHSTSRNTGIVVGKNANTTSKPKVTWREFWHQKTRHLHIGKYYSFKSKFFLAIFNLSWIFTWGLAIISLVLGCDWQLVAYVLLVREIILLSSIILATKKLGISFEMTGIIFVDILYVIYYIFVGIRALIVKTISWA